MAGSFVASVVPSYQVFLNFRGEELRHTFISHLDKALREKNINVFIDENAAKGEKLNTLLEKIEESKIALAIFSHRYTESIWCLNELVKIKECMDEGNLVTIPIFYKLSPDIVKHQKGAFGDALRENAGEDSDDRMKKWKEALKSVSELIGLTFDGNRNENMFIDDIVEGVLKALRKVSPDKSTRRSSYHSQNTEDHSRDAETEKYGLKQRLNELEDKVNIEKEETRIIGIVGMHGIGKTTLVKEFYKKWKRRFLSRGLLQDISDIVKFDASGLNCNLPGMLLKKLLKYHDIDEEERYELYKEELVKRKVFIVLDGVNSKRQIEVLLEGHHEWILKGSKILIATSDQSLLHDLVDDIYVVPQLDYREGLNHFHHYAFDHDKDDKETFMKLSEEFVHYVRGHPLTLELLGQELRGEPLDYWEEKLKSLAQSTSQSIRDRVLQVSYDELSQEQKDAFLDIACFRSHDLSYVKSVLDSSSGSQETNIIKALADKFLINISDSSRVEMHDLLYTFATETDSKAGVKGRHQRDITKVLQNQKGPSGNNVKAKGIFLDLFHMNKERALCKEHFKKMRDLRYLKLYSSHCPQECNPDHKIYLPDKLDFPLEEVRCLHWLKYPLQELPHNFNPKNLVDLKLPYSKVEHIWDHKDAPKLKWVDLNHSSKLKTLSGLSKAQKLQRLNLEGCTALETVDPELQSMKSLVLLNLKGCTALESFLDTKCVPLKTLILSNCSKLKNFLVVSETLEALYLDGTAITELPTTMVRLVILSVKDCKMLEKLPQGFDKLKDLQELVCSGCSILSILPDEMENMNFLQILLLDGTSVTKIPTISSLERLSLSGNGKIICLPENISQLTKLKWLDLKYCTKLLSIPELPPNLQYLDAHGCESLRTVANPLATRLRTEQIHSTFIFTNCRRLDRTAKEEITSYAQRKCQLLSDALKRCSEGFVPEALFSTCFPGCEVPSWFCHESVGSVLKAELSPHWNENRFVGIALCAVLSFPNSQERINSFSVTCKFNLKFKDGPGISFERLVGSWNRHGKKSDKMASDHVFICYIRCSNNIKCLEEQQGLGACTPTTASLEFGVTDEEARLEVLKCGLRLVYASDANNDASSTQIRNGGFTTGSNGIQN
ncbi:Disease resistance protein (TIR-NBS-LRR class) family [Raphanus sativus]|uniref:ADP-ribosyl cyclase/cyclic ADP-ribose hydrolase n=1 Tax=Raphanus sativus TaxID=3726 RepID=A0A9W3C958_RAPSA|nr:probable disease resistance protein At4g19530 [Raphanus sativus]KAJ4880991.1 Disease resistance protein (TIR-NBS-LRR class) family [Raphanus sativus]